MNCFKVLLLFLVSLPLFSQNKIQGIVLDAESGNPLFGALAEFEEVSTLSNEDGKVELSLDSAPPYSLIIRSLGFTDQSVQIEKTDQDGIFRFVVRLVPLSEELSTVVITASRFEQKQEELSVSLSVLKPYLIENRNTKDADNLLQLVPGVHMTDGQLNIRNGSGWTYGAGTRVQVLLDDMPLISPDAGQVQWDLMPLEAIGQIEVLKGSSSALFGTSALNGVVQVRSMTPPNKPITKVSVFQTLYDNPPRPELKWWRGTRGLSGVRMLHAFKKAKHEVVLNAYGQKDEGFKFDEIDNRLRTNASWLYRSSSRLSFGLSGGLLWSKNGESLLWDSEDRGYIALDSSVTITEGVDFYIDPKVEWRVGHSRHKAQARYMRVENRASNRTTNFDNASDQIQLQYNYQFFTGNWVLSGGVYSLYAESRSQLFEGFHTSSNWAVFGQLDRKWKSGQVNFGLRYESQYVDQTNYAKPVMRIGLNQAVSESIFLRASFGQGFRFPSMAELFTSTSIGLVQIYPNTELQVESGYSAEIGVRKIVQVGGWNSYIDAALYMMQFENMMEFSFSNWGVVPGNVFGVGFKSVNIGPARISGIEFEVGAEKKWDDWKLRFLGGINFSIPKALDPTTAFATDSAGREINYINSSSDPSNDMLKYRYSRLLRLDAEVEYNKWTFGLSIRNNDYMQNVDWIFEDPELSALFNLNVKNARERLRRDDWLIDTRLYYRINQQWSFGFLVENLLNYEIMSRPTELEAPRRFTLNLRFAM